MKNEWVKAKVVTKPRGHASEKCRKLFEVYESLHVLKKQSAMLEIALS